MTRSELWKAHKRAAKSYTQIVDEMQRRERIEKYGTDTPEGLRHYEVEVSIECSILVKAASADDAEQIAGDLYATTENDQIDFLDSSVSVDSVAL